MNEPWQCPSCKTWYAPHVDQCWCENKKQIELLVNAAAGVNNDYTNLRCSPCLDQMQDMNALFGGVPR